MANFVVTTLDDDTFDGGDLAAETADGNGLSLREALGLALANGAGTADTITFDTSLTGTLTLTNGELVIASDVTIDGDTNGDNGADITIDASFGSRVFDVSSGTATIDSLTIKGGYGSGVRIAAAADLTLINSTVASNYSSSAGGGIVNYGAATLISSTLSSNNGHHGGALANFGTATLVNVTLADNDGSLGAGIYNGTFSGTTGTLTLVSSTLSGNDASDYGGGVYNHGDATLINSIVAGNTAYYSGSDIRTAAGGTTTYSGVNIFSQAGAGDAQDLNGVDVTDVFVATTASGGGVLADNGGPVQTIALLQGGLAQNAGDDSFLSEATAGVDLTGDGDTNDTITTDARGDARVAVGQSDVGAYEIQTLIVTTLDDEAAGSTDLATEATDGNGLSLREALAIADATAGHDTIVFDASLTGGSNPGVDDGVMTLTAGQLAISSDVTIDGDTNGDNAADITIDANGGSRVLKVTGGTSTLESLTITGGANDVSDPGAGGGIRISSAAAELTVVNSTITGNDSTSGGGIATLGSLTLINSTLSGNSALTHDGGGIHAFGAPVTLVNTTVAGNSSQDYGGGIYQAGSTLTIVNSTFSGNSALSGAGGGVYTYSTATTIGNSILLGNYAPYGSNTFFLLGTTTYAGVNIVDVGVDTDPSDNVINAPNFNAVFASVGADPHTGVTSGLLADNGGPVETIALNRDLTNPALDAGDATLLDEATTGVDLNGDGDTNDVITTDARGFARSVDLHAAAAPDLGAFEAQADSSLVVTTLDDSGANLTVTGDLAAETADGGGLSLREALILANNDFDGDPTNATHITFDASLAGTVTLTGGQLAIASDVTIDGDTNGDHTADITIDANNASRIFDVTGGTSTLDALTITGGNAGTANGGGVQIGGSAALTIVNSTVSGNSAYYGGGIHNDGAATLTNTTLSGNSAATYGGGLSNYGAATLTNVTLSGNSAAGSGGGLANGDTATLTNVTVSGNSAGARGGGISSPSGGATLTNSIVAGNSATISGDDISGTGITYSGINLFSQTGAGGADGIVESDLTNVFASVGADPHTGVTSGLLADNGGPVETILILRGGAAQNTGDNGALPPDTQDLDHDGVVTEPLPVDARGENRVAETTVDLGAVELNALPDAKDDGFATDEATNVAASVLDDNGNGVDSGDHPLTVTMVDGAAFTPGVAFTLASGAQLTMNSDGTFTYDSNDVFDYLPVGNVAQDSFTYTVDDGYGGTDTATVTVDITGLDTNDTFVGTPGPDAFSGGVGNDTMKGLGGDDTLKGGNGKDLISGGNGDDRMIGNRGDDLLDGGKGNDKETGGSGRDTFVFDTALSKHHNVDKITDFKVNHDLIGLGSGIFTAVGAKLSKGEFHIGTKAHDANDHIIYDKTTGNLFYDKDGKGGAGQVQFATLDKGLNLSNHDFMVGDFVL